MLETQFATTEDLTVYSSVFRLIPSGAGIARELVQIELQPSLQIHLEIKPGEVKIQIVDPNKKLDTPAIYAGLRQLGDVIINRKDR